MNTETKLHHLVGDETRRRTIHELALGFLRYEALRKCNPMTFQDLFLQNLHGARFDDLVDELITREVEP